MRKLHIIALAFSVFLLSNCSGENKSRDAEILLPEKTWKRIESPKEFKDLVLKATFSNDFSLLDSVRYFRADLERTFSPKDTVLIHTTWKRSFDSLISSVSIMVDYRDESSFEEVVRAGRKYGIDWTSPSGLSMEKTSGKVYPGYLITVAYTSSNGKYNLTMQTDSADKGFLLGSKLELQIN